MKGIVLWDVTDADQQRAESLRGAKATAAAVAVAVTA